MYEKDPAKRRQQAEEERSGLKTKSATVSDAAKKSALLSAAKTGGSMGINAATGNDLGIGGGGTIGTLAALAGAGIGGYNILNSDLSGDQKLKATTRLGEDTVGNYMTAGLTGVGQKLGSSFAPEATKQVDKLRDMWSFGFPGVGSALDVVADKGLFGGKSKEQQRRDAVRAVMQKAGMFGGDQDDWILDNPDGTGFDVGKDGDHRLDDGRRYWELDMNSTNPVQSKAIGAVNPLAYLITGGDKDLATQFAGEFTNTIMQGKGGEDYATANINALDKYKKAGFDSADKANLGIDELLKSGKIDEGMAVAFRNGINTVFGTTPAQPIANNNTSQQKPIAKPKPKQKKEISAPVSLASLVPQFTKAPVMQEPDNAPTVSEAAATAAYRQMLEAMAQKRNVAI